MQSRHISTESIEAQKLGPLIAPFRSLGLQPCHLGFVYHPLDGT